jgi:hypothetical protein
MNENVKLIHIDKWEGLEWFSPQKKDISPEISKWDVTDLKDLRFGIIETKLQKQVLTQSWLLEKVWDKLKRKLKAVNIKWKEF